MNANRLEIAIAGAGIGGLSAATMLAKLGAKVVIYDQMAAPQPVGSGFVLQPTGSQILAGMGLLEKAQARGASIHRMIGRLAGGDKVVLDVRYRHGSHGIAIQRVALFDILLEAAIGAGVTFETAAQVTDVVDGPRPALVLSQGRRTPPFDLVIDAMGANSPLAFAPAGELTYGALWATVPWPNGGPFDADKLEQRYHRANRMAGVLPVGTASTGAPAMATFFWSLRNRDVDAWRAAGRDAWIEEVAAIWPEAVPLAEVAEPVHARYRHHTRAPLARRRIIRIGDSWHATSPQLGQGANMALLDAASLSAALKTMPGVDEALHEHIRKRRAHIRLYQMLSLLLTPVYQSDSRVLPALRDLLTGPMSRLPVVSSIITTLVTGELLNPLGNIDEA